MRTSPGLDSVDPIAVSGKRLVGGWTIASGNLLSSAPFRGHLPLLLPATPPRISPFSPVSSSHSALRAGRLYN